MSTSQVSPSPCTTGLEAANATNIILFLNRDLLTSTTWVKDRSEFFPRLKSLTIEGDASLCLMETLISSITNLATLSIFVHSFSVPTGQFDAMILNQVHDNLSLLPCPTTLLQVKCGNLAKLETLQCFQWEVSLDTMLYLIDQSTQLRKSAATGGRQFLMIFPQDLGIGFTHDESKWCSHYQGPYQVSWSC